MTTIWRVTWRETTTRNVTTATVASRMTEHVEDHPTRLGARLRAAQLAQWAPMVYEIEVQP